MEIQVLDEKELYSLHTKFSFISMISFDDLPVVSFQSIQFYQWFYYETVELLSLSLLLAKVAKNNGIQVQNIRYIIQNYLPNIWINSLFYYLLIQ